MKLLPWEGLCMHTTLREKNVFNGENFGEKQISRNIYVVASSTWERKFLVFSSVENWASNFSLIQGLPCLSHVTT